jgi:cytochrome b561
MSIGFLFWLLMVLWLFFGMWSSWPAPGQPGASWRPVGGSLLLWVLLFILGWRVFGFVIKQ